MWGSNEDHSIRTKFVQSQLEAESKTPPLSRHDSLVLSVTAQKMQSPYQSDLLRDSYQYINYNLTERTNALKDSNQKSNNLNFLGERLELLEGKIRSIKTQRVSTQSDGCPQVDVYQIPQFDKQNNRQILNMSTVEEKIMNKSGFIIKKQKKPCNLQIGNLQHYGNLKTRKNSICRKSVDRSQKSSHQNSVARYIVKCSRDKNASKRIATTFIMNRSYGTPTNSIKNKSMLESSSKEIGTLKTQLLKLERKAEKSERSRSLFARRLSETKKSLSLATSQKKQNKKQILELQKKLKKSENIRMKQKQTIFKQRKQIEQLKKIIKQIQKQTQSNNY